MNLQNWIPPPPAKFQQTQSSSFNQSRQSYEQGNNRNSSSFNNIRDYNREGKGNYHHNNR